MTLTSTKKILLASITAAFMLQTVNAHAENEASTDAMSFTNSYANADLKLRLAITPNAETCEAETCVQNERFDDQVKTIAAMLSVSVYEALPNEKDYPSFEFEVINKAEMGTASNAQGKVVVYRDVQKLQLSDAALTFIIAREMGHVLAKHNSKNASTKLWITAIASVAFPAISLLRASAAAAQASAATTLVSSVGSSVTSAVGGKMAVLSAKPAQLAEADEIAYQICATQHIDMAAVMQELKLASAMQGNGWLKDLQKSQIALEKRLSSTVASAN